jgi:hypothetical protein
VGQKKTTEFYVLWVDGETHDTVSRDTNKLRMKEAEVLTRIAPQRLARKRSREENDEEYEE